MPPDVSGPPRAVRALNLHHGPRREPRAVLERMLDRLDATPAVAPDEPVARLERRIADILGKEEALFLPTGAMAQQVALRIHADRRARRAFAGHPQCQIDVWEHQGYNAVHGLRFLAVGDRHRLMTTADLAEAGEPLAAAVWELPQRDLGGQLPSWTDLTEQIATVRAGGAAAHMDGARLWEAQPFYDRPHADIAALFDTVYVSLYKALLGVRGAMLAADAATIAEARIWRKRLGGEIPDAWPLALAAEIGLDELLPNMGAYRDHAVAIAEAVNDDGIAYIHPDPPQTPLFHVHLPAPKEAVERAAEELIAERGTRLLRAARTAPDPRHCSFEVTIGENGLAFAPDEVAALLRELVERAGGPR